MEIKTESVSRNIARAIATGALLSILFFYGVHVLGTWEIEYYRPDPQTTTTILLHNKCAVFGKTHTLRPNTEISVMNEGINGTKLGGSFMNFTDDHVTGLVILSLLMGGVVFVLRSMIKKRRQSRPAP